MIIKTFCIIFPLSSSLTRALAGASEMSKKVKDGSLCEQDHDTSAYRGGFVTWMDGQDRATAGEINYLKLRNSYLTEKCSKSEFSDASPGAVDSTEGNGNVFISEGCDDKDHHSVLLWEVWEITNSRKQHYGELLRDAFKRRPHN